MFYLWLKLPPTSILAIDSEIPTYGGAELRSLFNSQFHQLEYFSLPGFRWGFYQSGPGSNLSSQPLRFPPLTPTFSLPPPAGFPLFKAARQIGFQILTSRIPRFSSNRCRCREIALLPLWLLDFPGFQATALRLPCSSHLWLPNPYFFFTFLTVRHILDISFCQTFTYPLNWPEKY